MRFLSKMKDFVDEVLWTFDENYEFPDIHFYSRVFANWFGEVMVGLGIESRARRHNSDVFIYRNCSKFEYSISHVHAGSLKLRPYWSKCDHGDCLNLLFGLPFADETAQGMRAQKYCKLL